MKHVIGFDFGGTNLNGGVVKEDGKIMRSTIVRKKTRNQRPGTEIVADMVKMIKKIRTKTVQEILAVGVGAPGIWNIKTGTPIFPPCNCPNFGRVNIKRTIEKMTGLSVFVNNDAQVFAAGENRWGNGKGSKCFLLLTIGTGIGGALYYNGHDFTGTRNCMEIGHTCVNFFTGMTTPLCGCGLRGCVEAYASDTAVANSVKQAIKAGYMPKPKKGATVDSKYVYDQMRTGDDDASVVVKRAHHALATLIANYANTLSIDTCILAGGVVSGEGQWMIDDIQKRVNSRLLNIPGIKVKILPSALGKNFSILGAGAYAFERLGKK